MQRILVRSIFTWRLPTEVQVIVDPSPYLVLSMVRISASASTTTCMGGRKYYLISQPVLKGEFTRAATVRLPLKMGVSFR